MKIRISAKMFKEGINKIITDNLEYSMYVNEKALKVRQYFDRNNISGDVYVTPNSLVVNISDDWVTKATLMDLYYMLDELPEFRAIDILHAME